MSFKFHVLASGSSGNASVIDAGGFGVLIDFGLSPNELAPRMQQCCVTWEDIHAVVLTHMHSDHWRPATLTHFAKLGLPIYCHPEHLDEFNQDTRAFRALTASKQFRSYDPGEWLILHDKCQVLPIELPHDGARTCGFRFDGPDWACGYATDLGCWTRALARAFADVDLLALEFNHDVEMQMQSGRSPLLIRRVLGDHGHLSNEQAAAFLCDILRRSGQRRLRHLVQLHLSRDCNRPDLALTAAEDALAKMGIDLEILTADQDQTGVTIQVRGRPNPAWRRRPLVQPMLAFPE
jgi:phosphoribosyl 1,2-cyclic phosphodiesterase